MDQREEQRIRVLFVDDDARARARLSEMVREVPEWDCRFADGGHAALAELEFRGPCDVIVADLRMPAIDGAALLDTVRELHPQTVRIISSDFHDLPSALRTIPVAHQFLEAPIDASKLRRAVDRGVEMQRRLHDPALRRMVGQIDVLPSPPLSVIELNRALLRPDASLDDIVHVIEADAAMTAKLLQLVNSAFFGLSHRVTNAKHAVSFLGLATVRNLLTAVELVRAFVPPNAELVHAVEEIHRHSLTVAELARSFMGRQHQVHEAFAAGMMHEIGLLAVVAYLPDRYLLLREEVKHSGRTAEECERDVLGASHAQLGALLLDLWGLPQLLVEAVARSHDADTLPEPTLSPVHAVFVAEQVVNMTSPGGLESWHLPEPEYLAQLGLAETVTSMVSRVKT